MGVQDRDWWREKYDSIQRATYNPRPFRRRLDVPYTLTDAGPSRRRGTGIWKLVLIWLVIGLVVFGIAKKVMKRLTPQPGKQERMWQERGKSAPSRPLQQST